MACLLQIHFFPFKKPVRELILPTKNPACNDRTARILSIFALNYEADLSLLPTGTWVFLTKVSIQCWGQTSPHLPQPIHLL